MKTSNCGPVKRWKERPTNWLSYSSNLALYSIWSKVEIEVIKLFTLPARTSLNGFVCRPVFFLAFVFRSPIQFSFRSSPKLANSKVAKMKCTTTNGQKNEKTSKTSKRKGNEERSITKYWATRRELAHFPTAGLALVGSFCGQLVGNRFA